MKCSHCGHWNRVPVNKLFIEQPNPIEPKVRVMIPMYEPLETSKCEKCGKVIAEPKELMVSFDSSMNNSQLEIAFLLDGFDVFCAFSFR
jgi:RNase P subunit RPR2